MVMKEKIKKNVKKMVYMAPAMIGFGAISAGKLLPPMWLWNPWS
jgi:hypothetical protein